LLVLNYLVILFFYPAGGAHGTTPLGPPGNTTTVATGGLGAMGSADFARNASFFVADSVLNPMKL
jgi:hypothetical protein